MALGLIGRLHLEAKVCTEAIEWRTFASTRSELQQYLRSASTEAGKGSITAIESCNVGSTSKSVRSADGQ
jgi:hypothetical protein